ncbi:hypothetical protein ACROYT_G042170 [Oculina patagonica]
MKSHLPSVHTYADDTQLYISFNPVDNTSEAEAVIAIENCIQDVRAWMRDDKLMLNDDKTEFLIIGTERQLSRVSVDKIKIGQAVVSPVSSVRNLGTWFDSHLDMSTHVTKACASAFYYLYNIRHIRKYLSRESTERLVHAFITSRLDYCNSLLYGAPEHQIKKLQRVMNASARLVYRAPKYCHITPLLRELHWLPVRFRIDFKILLITFKILHGVAPSYLKDLKKRNISIKYYYYYYVLNRGFGEVKKFMEGPEMKNLTKRLEKRLQITGKLSLTFDFVEKIFRLCAFGVMNRGDDTWCALLDDEDIKVLEYQGDLEHYYEHSYGNELSYKIVCPLLSDITQILRDVSTAKSDLRGIFRFTSSGTLFSLLTMFGLLNQNTPLRADNYQQNSKRNFTSNKVPMAGNIAVVLFECNSTEKAGKLEHKLQVMVNEKPVSLPCCHGNTTCSLGEFLSCFKETVHG